MIEINKSQIYFNFVIYFLKLTKIYLLMMFNYYLLNLILNKVGKFDKLILLKEWNRNILSINVKKKVNTYNNP